MFSRLEELDEGIVLRGDTFIIKEDGKELPVCTTSEIKLLSSHNHENILAAIGITYYMGVPVEQIRDAVMKFTAVEHRIEYVDTVDGVDYYNDSKGTNPDAAIKGISAMTKPTILLGGGYDKKSTYDEWIDAFHGKVRYLIVMGATAQAIADTAKNHGFHNVIFADTFEEAMNIAKEKARPEMLFYFHRHVQAGACSKIMKFEARYLKKSSESLRGECCAEEILEETKKTATGHGLFHIISGAFPGRIWSCNFIFHQFL